MEGITLNDMFQRRVGGRCPFCDKTVDTSTFRNTLSLKEYNISGLCQECQDEVFKPLEEVPDVPTS